MPPEMMEAEILDTIADLIRGGMKREAAERAARNIYSGMAQICSDC